MKNSSYVLIPLFSILLGTVIIFPQISFHPAASVPPTEPTVVLEISDSSSVHAAPVPETVVAAVTTTPPVRVSAQALPVQKQALVSKPLAVVTPSHPVRLSIPAIALSSPVIPVTINDKGEMDVPNGKTNNVGWYEPGVVPGETGSAVIDAHVYAAFKNLHALSVGDAVYIDTAGGEQLHFVVVKTQAYALSELTPTMLFETTDGRHLNLVTCAGNLTPDRTTYDHRRIVYTELVQ